MKRMMKSVLGVTLLEIMLVLAIAAMIIVMSIRYYQSAQASSQANAFVSQVEAIAASAENLAQGTGKYPSSAALTPILPAGALSSPPWGGTLSYGPQPNGFTLTFDSPGGATCALFEAKLKGSTQYTNVTCLGLTYTGAQ